MKEISNSTLALLVVCAIVVSIAGTFFSIQKLNNVGGLTGMFINQQTGYANLSVASSVSINITSIGADANASTIQLGIIDINQWNASDVVNDWWKVQNDGSVNISLQIYSGVQYDPSRGAVSQWSNNKGYGPFASTTTDYSGCVKSDHLHNCFMVKCNSSISGYDCNHTYYRLDNSTSDAAQLIVDLSNEDTVVNGWRMDEATFGVNVTVPLGEPSGQKIQSVIILATDSSI